MCNVSNEFENLRCVYEQYWMHLRHIENERLGITTIYGAFLAFAFSNILKVNNDISLLACNIVLIFIMLLSYIGFAINVRILVSFIQLEHAIKRITKKLCQDESIDWENIEPFSQMVEKRALLLAPVYRLYLRLCKIRNIPLPLTLLFPTIFILGFIVSLVFLVLANFGLILKKNF